MNNLKDKITDGIGVIIWAVGIYLLYCGKVEVWPGFILILAAGGVMFYIPDDWVTTHLKEWIKKKFQ